MIKLLLSLTILLTCVVLTNAREGQNKISRWSAGYVMGASNFMSTFNLTEKSSINHFEEDYNFSFGFDVDYKLNKIVSLEGEWINGKLSGLSEPNDPSFTPQISYRTNFNQLAISGLFNFNNIFSKKKFDRLWYIYGKAGAGVSFLDGKWDRTTLNNVTYSIPVGLGVNFRLFDKLFLGVESTISLGNDWLNSGQENTSSGNTYLETFHNTGIKISYRFGADKENEDDLIAETEPVIEVSEEKEISEEKQ